MTFSDLVCMIAGLEILGCSAKPDLGFRDEGLGLYIPAQPKP